MASLFRVSFFARPSKDSKVSAIKENLLRWNLDALVTDVAGTIVDFSPAASDEARKAKSKGPLLVLIEKVKEQDVAPTAA